MTENEFLGFVGLLLLSPILIVSGVRKWLRHFPADTFQVNLAWFCMYSGAALYLVVFVAYFTHVF